MPTQMLPEEIEKTLRKLGPDGDKVRGALERDFAAYVSKAAVERSRTRRILLLSILQPFLSAGAKRAANWVVSPDKAGFQRRLAELRATSGAAADDASASPESETPAPPPAP
jgi:hypothetical protein